MTFIGQLLKSSLTVTEEVFLNATLDLMKKKIFHFFTRTAQLQWRCHFSQRYGSFLDKTTFGEQISLRWDFLKKLQETVKLSTLIQSQTKFTVAQRSRRIQTHEDIQKPYIISTSKHKAHVFDKEILKCLQNTPVKHVITVDWH